MAQRANQNCDEISLLNGRVCLKQLKGGFRSCIDSVLVAAACPAGQGQRILDLGCGVGGITFCLSARLDNMEIIGIDREQAYLDIATENLLLNDTVQTANKINFIARDVSDYRDETRFDHVVCNPPFLEAGHHIPSPEAIKASAMGHGAKDARLEDWIDCAFYNLKPRGVLTIIHRSDMADKIIRSMGKRFGAIEIIPLWPKQGVDSKRVIIRATKDRKSPCMIRAGLVVHKDDGSYSDEAETILRGAQCLY